LYWSPVIASLLQKSEEMLWPRRQQAVIELTAEQLHLLLELDGVDVDAVRRHPARQPSAAIFQAERYA
jgi:hypothetical protein